jgi:DNA mismatch repair protein MutS2
VDEHTLALLEFPRVLEALAGLCASPQGSTLLASQPILTDPGELRAAHGLAVGFRAVLESGEPLPSLDFPDLDEVLPRLGKAGLLLDGEELAAVGRFVVSALALRRHVLKLSRDPALSALAEAIPDLAELPRAVFRVVDTDGSLRERQLPELAAIPSAGAARRWSAACGRSSTTRPRAGGGRPRCPRRGTAGSCCR